MKTYEPLKDIDSAITILSRVSLWQGFTGGRQQKIYKRLGVGTFKKGEYIFRTGEQPTHIYIVKSGQIDRVASDQDVVTPKESAITGVSFGVVALMAMLPHQSTAIAAEDSEIIVLSRQALHALYHEDPEPFAILMMNIAGEIAWKLNLKDSILLQYARERKGR